MIILPDVDLSTAMVGSSGTILLQNMGVGGGGVSANPTVLKNLPTLFMHNESGCGLSIILKDSQKSFNIAAGQWVPIAIGPGESAVIWKVKYILPNAPVNLLMTTYYFPGEPIPNIAVLGNSPIGIGGSVVTVASSNIVFNVTDPTYAGGAKGVGGDDTVAIQATITAAQNAGGGIVFFPGGTYGLSSSLLITHDYVRLVGSGRASDLQTLAGFPATPMVWVQSPGGAGNFRFGAGVSDLRLVNTVGSTSAIGIQFDSTYWAHIHRVDVEGIYANNIFLNGISTAFGAYTNIRDCHLGNVPSGAVSGGIGILTSNHEFNVIDSCVINWFKTAGGYGIKLQNGSNAITNCTFDENDTSIWVWFQSHNKIVSNQFDRGVTQFIYLNGCVDTTIASNGFQDFIGTGIKSMINIDTSSNKSNVIADNTCKVATGWTNFVSENANTGQNNSNIYKGNQTNNLPILIPGLDIVGTTLGTAHCYEDFDGIIYRVMIILDGYRNSTVTSQQFALPVPFLKGGWIRCGNTNTPIELRQGGLNTSINVITAINVATNNATISPYEEGDIQGGFDRVLLGNSMGSAVTHGVIIIEGN